MSYFTSADDYKSFYELSGNKSSDSNDHSYVESVAGGISGSKCVQNQDCGDMLYCVNGICSPNMPSEVVQPSVEPFRFNRNTGKFEPFNGYSRRH